MTQSLSVVPKYLPPPNSDTKQTTAYRQALWRTFQIKTRADGMYVCKIQHAMQNCTLKITGFVGTWRWDYYTLKPCDM